MWTGLAAYVDWSASVPITTTVGHHHPVPSVCGDLVVGAMMGPDTGRPEKAQDVSSRLQAKFAS